MIDWQFLDHRPWLRLHQSGSSNSWGTSLKWSSVYWQKWLHFLLSVAFMCSLVLFCSDCFADSLGVWVFYFSRTRGRQCKTLMCSGSLQFLISTNTGFRSSSSALMLPVVNSEWAAEQHGIPCSQQRSPSLTKAQHINCMVTQPQKSCTKPEGSFCSNSSLLGDAMGRICQFVLLKKSLGSMVQWAPIKTTVTLFAK